MRYKLLLPVMAFMLSCNFITGLGTGSTEGSVDYDAPAVPLNVTVVLNETDSVSGMIPPEGGELTLTSADGSVYTLEVPAGALDVEMEIVMTSVQSIDDTATGDGLFAVQLEPSGLRFNELVTLSITPAMNVSREDLLFIKYEGNGEDVHHALVDPFTEEIDVLLLDFSGIGYGFQSVLGTIFCIDGKCFTNTPSPQQRLENALGEASQKLAEEKTKAGKAKFKKQINSILDEYKKKEVDTLLKAAQNDCNKVLEAEDALNELEAFRKKFSPDNPNPPGDKKARETLKKVKDNCPKAYYAEGSIGPLIIKKVLVCDIRNFTISQDADYMGCKAKVTFSGGLKGIANSTLSDCRHGVTGSFKGTYTLSLDADGKTGIIEGSVTGNMNMPLIGPANMETFDTKLKLTETLKCY
jgi:hypothetical protein